MQTHSAARPTTSRSSRPRLEVALSHLAGWPRRLCACVCLLLAAVSFLTTSKPTSPGPSRTVLVASKDMGPGTEITPGDVRLLSLPGMTLPVDVLTASTEAVGHRIGAAVSRDEVLTKIRLVDTALSANLPRGHVALSVHLADHAQSDLLSAGSEIDLYLGSDDSTGDGAGELVNGQLVTPPAARGAGRVASDVRVLAVLPETDPDAGSALAVSVDSDTAARLAAHPNGPFVATLRPPP